MERDNKGKWVIVFIVSFLLYHFIGSLIFPVDEENVLQAPDWYPILGIAFAAVVTYLLCKLREKKAIGAIVDAYRRRKAQQAYDNLSEVEKWQLEKKKAVEQPTVSKDNYLRRIKVDHPKPVRSSSTIDIQQIIMDEQEWRRGQQGLLPVEYELRRIDSMEGHQFEHWCADLLKKNGFTSVEVTRGSGDQGVDITAIKDGINYAIQCKCYSSNLGNTSIQEVNTGKTIYHCQVGVVMTNRYFTANAKQAAEATGTLLWDRDKLVEMMEK